MKNNEEEKKELEYMEREAKKRPVEKSEILQ